jgi:hypothetical protein
MKKSVSVIFIFIFLVFSASADERYFDAAHTVYTNISGWGYGTPGPGIGYEHTFRLNKYFFLTLSAGLTFRINYDFFIEIPVAVGFGFGKTNHFYRPRLLLELESQHIKLDDNENENLLSLSSYLDAAHFVFKHFGFSFMMTGINFFSFAYGTEGSDLYTLSGDFIYTPLKITYLELKYRF